MANLHSCVDVVIISRDSSPVSSPLASTGGDPAFVNQPVHDGLPEVEPLIDAEEEEDPEERVFASDDQLSDAELPMNDEQASEYESADSDKKPAHINTDPPRSRPDCMNVFMAYIPLENYANVAYAFVNPPAISPAFFIRRALQNHAGNPRVAIRSACNGAGVVLFESIFEREHAILLGPFRGHERTVHIIRHDDTNNRFLFHHENLAALSIDDYPIEHWFPSIFSTPPPPMRNATYLMRRT